MRGLFLVIAAIGYGAAQAAGGQVTGAEAVYATAPPRLLQIRTLLASAGQQTSIGSAFLVSADGLAITNYHVVSHVVFEPNTYGSNTPQPTALKARFICWR